MMIVYIDIDNTICKTIGEDYKNATPIKENIDKANKYWYEGHTVIYWTARGTLNKQTNFFNLTLRQLNEWGCLFHELRLNKVVYDLLICDKTLNWTTDHKNDK